MKMCLSSHKNIWVSHLAVPSGSQDLAGLALVATWFRRLLKPTNYHLLPQKCNISDLQILNWSSLLGAVTTFRAFARQATYKYVTIKKKMPGSWWHNVFFWHKLFYFLSTHKCSIVVNQGEWIKCDKTLAPMDRLWQTFYNMFHLKHLKAEMSKVYTSLQRLLIWTTNISQDEL